MSVYLSYARQDLEFAERLRDALASAGRELLMTPDAIAPGDSWNSGIEEAILASEKFIFVISPDSLDSSLCMREVAEAQSAGKQIIPLVRKQPRDMNAVPAAIAELNWIIFDEDSTFDRSFTELLSALDTDLDRTRMQTKLLARAKEWADSGSDRSYLLRGTALRAAEQWLADSDSHPQISPTNFLVQYITASRRRRGRYRTPTPADTSAPPAQEFALPSESEPQALEDSTELQAKQSPSDIQRPKIDSAVRSVISLADLRARGRPVDASLLLLAALEAGQRAESAGVAVTLLHSLVLHQPRSDEAHGQGEQTTGTLLGRLSAVLMASDDDTVTSRNVDELLTDPPLSVILSDAASIASYVSTAEEISLRHFLAAAILSRRPPLQSDFLEELHVSQITLLDLLIQAAQEEAPDEPYDAWEEMLSYAADDTANARLAGGISSDRVDPTGGIPLNRDWLETGVWVSMLATVISDQATPMPLSVGIFGEWGSGKSYFMGLMRKEIERLSSSGPKPYLKNVVQIGFNAWHYADTNLWASLGDEIFRQLAGPGETTDEGRRRVREELISGSAEREALEARAAQARLETVRLRAELYEAMSTRQIRAGDLLHAIKNSRLLRQQLDKVWRKLGIDDEEQQALTLADYLSGTDGEAGAVTSVLGRQRTWTLIAICLIAALAVLAAVWAPPAWSRWLGGGGLAAVAVAIGVASTWVGRARSGLAQLRHIAADINKGAAASADQRTAEAVSGAVDELRQAEASEVVAQARLDEMSERVMQLARDLADLLPGQRLYSFLAERATSGQYTSHLGLVSTIRKDFEHLVELLGDWRAAGSDEAAPRPIDRIVLYIDDLDRCKPQQVVDVLQAVHLLLALELFVVVVGVDPRWLRRSLQHQYEGILGIGETREPMDQALWGITPNDYLEKIFNIPFVMPGIPKGSFERMLRGLSGPFSDKTERARADHPADGQGALVTAGQRVRTEPGAGVFIERHSELAASFTEESSELPRPLTEPELAFLGALEVYIDTPREAKRMFNLYRMIRSTRDLSSTSRFLGNDDTSGEYQAVAVLLCMMTADPYLLRAALNSQPQADKKLRGGLLYRPDGDHWTQFVSDFAPRMTNNSWSNQIVGKIEIAEFPRWRRFAEAAARTSHLVSAPELAPFKLWATRIQRFSYILTSSDE